MSDPQADPSSSSASPGEDARAFAVQAARIAVDNRAAEVLLLDVRGLCSFADYFIIGTGTSERQMRAVLDRTYDHARSLGRRPYQVSDRDATWMLADYVDVVIHMFDEKHRPYYDLESLWGDAPRLPYAPAPP